MKKHQHNCKYTDTNLNYDHVRRNSIFVVQPPKLLFSYLGRGGGSFFLCS